jgi:hypothetical protein
MLKGSIEQSKVSEVLIWIMKADRVQKGMAKFWFIVDMV